MNADRQKIPHTPEAGLRTTDKRGTPARHAADGFTPRTPGESQVACPALGVGVAIGIGIEKNFKKTIAIPIATPTPMFSHIGVGASSRTRAIASGCFGRDRSVDIAPAGSHGGGFDSGPQVAAVELAFSQRLQ
jgi:hypothetical protein